ncbi:hypothetical protein AGABI1DRAFT_114869 [Agaricus bisporus var. burnettii JB137-S8]|uniref:Uncharacterized protein n=1 Tax=Agaricus bisporus var. burnettii (strain JB137-S8 / ATCC MYA-4627 / FGSC 10392) TaxID=597362 RepID=K5XST2_AGABU|nr:uncharacterized protein AGABI1DRAFT_114869 [Agaricus bisporus var. burnettii JB137-S8]EKM78030.1 hypothetical protein AGABI1DRAFT_114869 [Agaricus bisporus var. burnettii JB137-S8]
MAEMMPSNIWVLYFATNKVCGDFYDSNAVDCGCTSDDDMDTYVVYRRTAATVQR